MCSIAIDEAMTDAKYAKAFIWTDFTNPKPIISAIDTKGTAAQ